MLEKTLATITAGGVHQSAHGQERGSRHVARTGPFKSATPFEPPEALGRPRPGPESARASRARGNLHAAGGSAATREDESAQGRGAPVARDRRGGRGVGRFLSGTEFVQSFMYSHACSRWMVAPYKRILARSHDLGSAAARELCAAAVIDS